MDDQMEKHFNVIAYLNFAYGGLLAAAALIVGAVFSLISQVPSTEMATEEAYLVGGIGAVIAFVLILFAIPYWIAGYAILKRFAWGRILGMILGALALFSIPIGTALGVYVIWAFTRPEAEEAFF